MNPYLLQRIPALMDFGFSLEQIAAALRDGVCAEKMRGMLLLQQAQMKSEPGRKRNVSADSTAESG